jgi:lipopolysaccharide/colanic/teichoic acid biosynthesis glycosyltransferase
MENYSNDTKVLQAARYYPDDKPVTNQMQSRLYIPVKKTMDMLGAFIGLVLCSPLFVVLACLIKLEDPKGAVFFKQIRIGKDGKPFYMYKFRSMVSNSEQLLDKLIEKNEINGAMFKIKDDPRITKIGKLIRKTSLDELPQLWNVLKGEMSLVGPRPPLPREVEKYTSYDRMRLLVIPGCTGLWQVSGRSGLSFDEMVYLDLYYIRNRSIWFDVKLIMKTFWIIVFPKNAY